MFATEKYIESAIIMFRTEETLTGNVRFMVDTNYHNVANYICSQPTITNHRSNIFMLASWDLPLTIDSIKHPNWSLVKDTLAKMMYYCQSDSDIKISSRL